MTSQQNKTKTLWIAVLGFSLIIFLTWLLWLYPQSANKISSTANNANEFASFRDKLKNAFGIFANKGEVKGETTEKVSPQIQDLRNRVFGN